MMDLEAIETLLQLNSNQDKLFYTPYLNIMLFSSVIYSSPSSATVALPKAAVSKINETNRVCLVTTLRCHGNNQRH